MARVPGWRGYRLGADDVRVVQSCSLTTRPRTLRNVVFMDPERELVARMGYDPRRVTLRGLERALALESDGSVPASEWARTVERLSAGARRGDVERRLFRSWIDGSARG